jgi:hypothetical protein
MVCFTSFAIASAHESMTMSEKTCAACDCPLDSSAIPVRIGGRTVEVCCDDCAVKLREAQMSSASGQMLAQTDLVSR